MEKARQMTMSHSCFSVLSKVKLKWEFSGRIQSVGLAQNASTAAAVTLVSGNSFDRHDLCGNPDFFFGSSPAMGGVAVGFLPFARDI